MLEVDYKNMRGKNILKFAPVTPAEQSLLSSTFCTKPFDFFMFVIIFCVQK